jgi:hypothetical protein
METKVLSEKESLELITRMIQNTQQKMEERSGSGFLIWGYVTVVFAIAVYLGLHFTSLSYYSYVLYLGIPIVGYPLSHFLNNKREKQVTTYIDRIRSQVWIVIGLTTLVVTLPLFFGIYTYPLAIISLLIGLGTTITGLIVRYRILVITGSIAILFFVPLFALAKYDFSNLIFAAVFLVMQIIPGHIINSKGIKTDV